jgi:hypothetical protein
MELTNQKIKYCLDRERKGREMKLGHILAIVFLITAPVQSQYYNRYSLTPERDYKEDRESGKDIVLIEKERDTSSRGKNRKRCILFQKTLQSRNTIEL